MIAQIDSIATVTNYVFRSRILVVSSSHQFLHSIDVERSHYLRVREVAGNGTRNTHLRNQEKTFSHASGTHLESKPNYVVLIAGLTLKQAAHKIFDNYLIDFEIRIGSNDGTGGEVNSLSHQISTNSTFFRC